MSSTDLSQRILRAIRGEDDIGEVVAAAGIAAVDEGQHLQLDVPGGVPVVTPSPGDVARGLLAMWARGGSDLRRWARYLLALPDVDLAELENQPSGELILNGIWDAAAGDEVDDRSLDAARTAVE